jgi:hypothetical protein
MFLKRPGASDCVAQPLPKVAKDWENLNRNALAFLRRINLPHAPENSVIPFDVPGQTLI